MKMKDNESIKDYSGKLMDVVNQMRLLGNTFEDHKVVEKLMMSVPQKFEAKISVIEESCDLKNLTIAKLISKLHVQEQRVQMRDDEAVKGAFQANNKGMSVGNLQEKNLSSFLRERQVYLQEHIFSYCALIAEELTMLRKIVGLRVNLLSSVSSVIILAIVRNFAESRRNNLSNKYNNKQMFLKKAKMMRSTCLRHHKLAKPLS